MIEVRPVLTKKDEKLFIDLPWRIYSTEDQKAWVPPLRLMVEESIDTKKNPFYQRAERMLFLAFQSGKLAGRIAAILNRAHNEFHDEKAGFYGFYECVNDQAVSDALFGAAETWLKSKGAEKMLGPTNPSTNHECGLLVRGQSQHATVMTTWNPKYYLELHEKTQNLKAVKDLVAYALPVELMTKVPTKVHQLAESVRASEGITFRNLDLKNFKRDIEICFDIYNEAWEKNWGFFPMTKAEFEHMAESLKMIIDPDLAFIVEAKGKPAGFMLGIPDLNYILKRIPNGKLFPTGIAKLIFGRKLLRSVRILALGVKKEFRGTGIFALFTQEAFNRAKQKNLLFGEASWILEDNEAMNKPWKDMGAPLYRRWRLFEKQFT